LKSLTADQIKKLAAYLVMMTIGLAVIDGKWTSRGRTQERESHVELACFDASPGEFHTGRAVKRRLSLRE